MSRYAVSIIDEPHHLHAFIPEWSAVHRNRPGGEEVAYFKDANDAADFARVLNDHTDDGTTSPILGAINEAYHMGLGQHDNS